MPASIDAVCSHCQALYRLADTMIGKQVRCKHCQQGFTVQEVVQATAEPQGEVQAKLPARPAGAKSRLAADDAPRRSSTRPPVRDREPSPEGPHYQVPAGKGGSMALILCLSIGGAVLFLGGGITALVLLLSGNKPAEVAANDDEVTVKLADLQSPEVATQLDALNWFTNNIKEDHPKRADVARELLNLYQRFNFAAHNDVALALKLWATKDQAPKFLDLAKSPEFGMFGRQVFCCEMLGRLKDKESIDFLVERLRANPNEQGAIRGLTAMGPMAKEKLFPLFFHPGNFGAQQLESQKLIRSRNVPDDEILNQALVELKKPDQNVWKEVCRYLANPQTPVSEKRRPEIAKGLNAPLESNNRDLPGLALAAIKRWGTKDNVEAVIRRMKQTPFNGEIATVLGNLKDDRAVEALLDNLKNIHGRNETMNALKTMGPQLARKPVLGLFNHQDGFIQQYARTLVRDWEVTNEEVVKQCLQDLNDNQRRGPALNWLEKAKVVPALTGEVNDAARQLLGDNRWKNSARMVLKNWATKDQALANAGMALTNLLSMDFGIRREAVETLKASAPAAARKDVLSQFNHPNVFIRGDVRGLLRDWSFKNEDYVKQCLADIKGNDVPRGKEALVWLSQAPVIPALANDVTGTARPLMASNDRLVSAQAKTVVGRWGPLVTAKDPVKENPATTAADKYLANLQNLNQATRHKAIQELGKLKEERAVVPLAFLLTKEADKALAIAALKNIGGKQTETAMCKMLTNPSNRPLVGAICSVLKTVGTEASLEALNTAAKYYGPQGTNHQFSYTTIQSTIKKINERAK